MPFWLCQTCLSIFTIEFHSQPVGCVVLTHQERKKMSKIIEFDKSYSISGELVLLLQQLTVEALNLEPQKTLLVAGQIAEYVQKNNDFLEINFT